MGYSPVLLTKPRNTQEFSPYFSVKTPLRWRDIYENGITVRCGERFFMAIPRPTSLASADRTLFFSPFCGIPEACDP
jgi:hypothetical protein